MRAALRVCPLLRQEGTDCPFRLLGTHSRSSMRPLPCSPTYDFCLLPPTSCHTVCRLNHRKPRSVKCQRYTPSFTTCTIARSSELAPCASPKNTTFLLATPQRRGRPHSSQR
jgi:hypothetical protein